MGISKPSQGCAKHQKDMAVLYSLMSCILCILCKKAWTNDWNIITMSAPIRENGELSNQSLNDYT